MKKRGLIILLFLVTPMILLWILKGDKLIGYLNDYLSKSEQVSANILLVEGWLPDYAIIKSCEEFRKNGYDHIITTGINSSPDYFNIHSNGYLIFYPGKRFAVNESRTSHTIEVNAYCEPGGGGNAHFKVYINNTMAGDFFASKRKKKYSITWKGSLNQVDSVMVQFDNDSIDESGDRNLYIKSICADHSITIPWLNNTVYDMLKSDGHLRLVNNITSSAENARMRLILSGIDSSLITSVPAKKVLINRTLSGALAFRDWLGSHDLDIKGINIVSMGPHARRTWMTYSKVLNNKYKIGIIPVPYNQRRYSHFGMTLKTLREAAGLLYYHIILIPYQ